jgi:hypothetical protein
VFDLEEQVTRVWNPDIRPQVDEAFRCYSTGAARACITLTWVAVCTDLIEKIGRLAEDGEGEAVRLADKVESARGSSGPQAVKAMQETERAILDVAAALDLVDGVEKRDLERLREDRNLCAHPSLRPPGELYEPSIQYARTHLAVALQALLVHPPAQERKVISRFCSYIADPSFTASPEYLTHVFFDSVKTATRRQIVDLAVKHAVLELEAPDPPGAMVLADRMAECVLAFAKRDRALVRSAITKAAIRLREAGSDVQFRVIGRLGDLDIFWESLDQATRSRITDLIAAIPEPALSPSGQLDPATAAVLSLVSVHEVRDLLPALQVRFESLSVRDRASVIALRPSSYFCPQIPQLLSEAASFRGAEHITSRAVIPCAPFLGEDQLSQALRNWAENDQCRQAGGMIQLAEEFYAATHLLPGSAKAWSEFIQSIQELEPRGSRYRYEHLETLLKR